jgi:hypothetical protein
MALRQAGSNVGRHLFEDGIMYASSEPCLMACYGALPDQAVDVLHSEPTCCPHRSSPSSEQTQIRDTGLCCAH